MDTNSNVPQQETMVQIPEAKYNEIIRNRRNCDRLAQKKNGKPLNNNDDLKSLNTKT